MTKPIEKKQISQAIQNLNNIEVNNNSQNYGENYADESDEEAYNYKIFHPWFQNIKFELQNNNSAILWEESLNNTQVNKTLKPENQNINNSQLNNNSIELYDSQFNCAFIPSIQTRFENYKYANLIGIEKFIHKHSEYTDENFLFNLQEAVEKIDNVFQQLAFLKDLCLKYKENNKEELSIVCFSFYVEFLEKVINKLDELPNKILIIRDELMKANSKAWLSIHKNFLSKQFKLLNEENTKNYDLGYYNYLDDLKYILCYNYHRMLMDSDDIDLKENIIMQNRINTILDFYSQLKEKNYFQENNTKDHIFILELINNRLLTAVDANKHFSLFTNIKIALKLEEFNSPKKYLTNDLLKQFLESLKIYGYTLSCKEIQFLENNLNKSKIIEEIKNANNIYDYIRILDIAIKRETETAIKLYENNNNIVLKNDIKGNNSSYKMYQPVSKLNQHVMKRTNLTTQNDAKLLIKKAINDKSKNLINKKNKLLKSMKVISLHHKFRTMTTNTLGVSTNILSEELSTDQTKIILHLKIKKIVSDKTLNNKFKDSILRLEVDNNQDIKKIITNIRNEGFDYLINSNCGSYSIVDQKNIESKATNTKVYLNELNKDFKKHFGTKQSELPRL